MSPFVSCIPGMLEFFEHFLLIATLQIQVLSSPSLTDKPQVLAAPECLNLRVLSIDSKAAFELRWNP